ncbi:MAG: cation-translocating P-type ATPase, partial [Deltaproteobacteria bacterium]|nr:cation-translocating P-type ATPase [Deltaproteobacteria bacterium]
MNRYCPVCGHVHEGEAHHVPHVPHALGGSGALSPAAREERGNGGQASAAEDDDEPAQLDPGPAAGDFKTVFFAAPGLAKIAENGLLKAELEKLAGVNGLDFNLADDLIVVSHRLSSADPIERVVRAFIKAAAPSAPKGGPAPAPPIPMKAKTAPSKAPKAPAAPAQGEIARFHVPAMCCAMEVNQLRGELSKMPGLGRLDFNLNARTVAVERRLLSVEAIGEVFKKAGFEASLLAAEEKPEEKPTPWKKYIVATLLAFAAEGLHWREAPIYWSVGLAILSFICCGFEVYKEGLLSFRRFRLDMNALMSLAVTGAVLIGEVAEGAMVLALFSLAEGLEDRSLRQARAAIADLLGLAPDKATVRSADGQWREINAEEVPVGTLIQIRPGEKLPLDGRVVSGFTTIDQAPVTGESVPVDKNPGDQVFAGTVNCSGSIEYETTAAFKDSTLAKVSSFVEATETQKAPVQRIVDKFAAYYTPTVFLLAFLVGVIPPLFLGQPWGAGVYKALVLLVISCPCALVISVPVTILCGLAAAAKKGLIIKGGAVLEDGRKIQIVALDKTGTITTGKPRETSFQPLGGADPQRANLLAASLAARSDHPVSRAIFESFSDIGSLVEVQSLMAYPGKGIGGLMAGREYHLGSLKLLPSGEWPDAESREAWREMTENGQTAVLLLEEGQPLAIFAVSDSIKDESLSAIKDMKAMGLKTVMLTGDNLAVAKAVAKASGVDAYYGELLPEDKAKVVADLKKEGVVAMAGDGINDAPALVTADIGLAMAMMGTDVAIETASVAIMDDRLSKIPAFVRLARSVWAIVVQNFVCVFAVKLAFLLLTMLGFTYMWMAVIADIGVCLIVVANGLRAMR